MNEIADLWKEYNISTELLKQKLGRTSNLLGEYAEYLVNEHLKGELLTASNASADIRTPNGEFYQVKSRRITGSLTTQLSIIRSWNFDYLGWCRRADGRFGDQTWPRCAGHAESRTTKNQ